MKQVKEYLEEIKVPYTEENAEWHDDFIKNMPSVTPIEEKPNSYFKFRMVR